MRASARMALALLVAAGLGGVYWWYSRGGQPQSPEDLAHAALNATTPRDQAAATIRLADSGPASVPMLRQVLGATREPEVQAAAITGLSEQWDYDSMNDFLSLAESESLDVRGRAAQAVMRMTGRQRPYTAEMPASERRILLDHMRKDWQEIQNATREDREELFRRLRESHEQKP